MLIKIEKAQIWQVATNEFWSTGKYEFYNIDDKNITRKLKINFNLYEYIEIRYQTSWYIRTVDNVYIHVDENELLKHCRLIGYIKESIWIKNKHSLKEILEQKLYIPIWEVV